jgi:hypothetical protein
LNKPLLPWRRLLPSGRRSIWWLLGLQLLLSCLPAPAVLPSPGTNAVTLAWDYSPSPEVIGYNVYYGDGPRSYQHCVVVANTNYVSITTLPNDQQFFFTCTAFDVTGLESEFSNEVGYHTPAAKVQVFKVTPLWSTNVTGPWQQDTNMPVYYRTNNGLDWFMKMAITNWWQ